MPQLPRSKNHLDSFRFAVEGIVHVFRTERHMRFHFVIFALVMALGLLYRLGRVEMALLFGAVSLVLITEMLNTAIENVVDMITQAYSPLAKLAKDIAAGAVLIASLYAFVVGIVVFLGDNRVSRLQIKVTNDPQPMMVLVAVSLLILIVVLISKVLGGKGSILSGGVVSGHSAVSFFIASTIMWRAIDTFTAIMALILAFLVAQSRVEGKIHTMQEVVLGGLLGLFVTTGIYYFYIPAH
ncbi:MAG: diacylglycerol kinase [Capsulimonadaceae bacterium]